MPAPIGVTERGTSGLNVDNLSFSVEVPSGADFLVAYLSLNNFTGSISSVIFNTSENLVQRIYQTNASSNRRTAIFVLADPTITTANINIQLSQNSQQIRAFAQAWENVDPLSVSMGATPVGANLSPASSSFELDLTTTQPNSVVTDCISVDAGSGLDPTGDNTGNELDNTSGSQSEAACSYADIPSISIANMDWDLVSSIGDGSMCAIELLDGGGAPSTLPLIRQYFKG